MHLRREYNKVTLERGQASAGPVAGKDGHGATTYRAGQTWEEGGDENPWRVSAVREPDDRETEERGPPKRVCLVEGWASFY